MFCIFFYFKSLNRNSRGPQTEKVNTNQRLRKGEKENVNRPKVRNTTETMVKKEIQQLDFFIFFRP